MRKRILLLLAIIVQLNLMAQEQRTWFSDNLNTIKIAPLNFIDFECPSLQLGYERTVSKEWLIEINGGIVLKRSLLGVAGIQLENTEDDRRHTFSGTKASIGVKKILKVSKNGIHNWFLGIEYAYRNTITDIWSSYYVEDVRQDYIFQEHRIKNTLNIKVGKQFVFNAFFMEVHWGLGVAHHNVEHIDEIPVYNKTDGSLFDYIHKDGIYLRLNLPINFKIGYRF